MALALEWSCSRSYTHSRSRSLLVRAGLTLFVRYLLFFFLFMSTRKKEPLFLILNMAIKHKTKECVPDRHTPLGVKGHTYQGCRKFAASTCPPGTR